jgi:hypothetical protein
LDYTIHWPELRSVDFTGAAEDNFSPLSVDATAASLESREVQAVWPTSADCAQSSRCAREHPKVVQTIMRHSQITLTMDTYGHLFPGQAAEAVFGHMLG